MGRKEHALIGTGTAFGVVTTEKTEIKKRELGKRQKKKAEKSGGVGSISLTLRLANLYAGNSCIELPIHLHALSRATRTHLPTQPCPLAVLLTWITHRTSASHVRTTPPPLQKTCFWTIYWLNRTVTIRFTILPGKFGPRQMFYYVLIFCVNNFLFICFFTLVKPGLLKLW